MRAADISEKMNAFWQHEYTGEPCVAVTAYQASADEQLFSRFGSEGNLSFEQLWPLLNNPEHLYRHNLRKMDHTLYFGDAIPSVFPDFGTGGHAAYFGCPFELHSDTVWFHPFLKDYSEGLEFSADNEVLRAQIDFIRYCAAKQPEHGYMIGMPDNCGSLDALAHIRGNEGLLSDLIEEPEAVKASVAKIVDALKTTGDAMYAQTWELNGSGSVQSWMQLWAPGKLMQLQCDFSVMISPRMYEEFVMPELQATVDWLDYSIYHLDGMEQIKFLDMLLSIKRLNAIQWTPVVGQPPTSYFIKELKRIQDAGKGLVLLPNVDELPFLTEHLKPNGIRLVLSADSAEHAEAIIKSVSGWR